MKLKRTGNLTKGFAVAVTVILIGCGDKAVTPDNSPPFSNPTKLAMTYVAYPTPDALFKSDTLKLSFDYNASKVKSIKVEATLDSAKTWITVATIAPTNSGKASVAWVVKDAAQTTFNFFGFKECHLRIHDTATGNFITTDTFKVIGAVPFVLTYPVGGEVLNRADSLKVLYSSNLDLASNISVCAKAAPDSVDWVRNIGTTVLITRVLPIETKSTTFVPGDAALKKTESFDFSLPLKLLLADYGPNGKRIVSGAITVR